MRKANGKGPKEMEESREELGGPVDDRRKQRWVNGGRRQKTRARKTGSGRWRFGKVH